MGARFKFWRRSRVPKKGSRDEAVEMAVFLSASPLVTGSAVESHSTILQRLRRQISHHYYTIPPAMLVCYIAVFRVVTQRSSPLTAAVCGKELCVTTLKTAV